MKVIKKFSFFLFLPRKLKRQRASNSEGAFLCCHKHSLIPFWTDYLQSAYFSCLLSASHLYYRCQIQWHWCSFLQSGAELHSQHSSFRVSDTKQIWHTQCQQRDVSLWCIQKRLYSAPCAPLHVLSPSFSCCFTATVLDPAGECRARAWPQLKYRDEKELSKLEEGGEYLYLLCIICLGTSSFYLIQSSDKSSQCLVPYMQAAAGCCTQSESWRSVINDYRSCML